MCCALTNIYIGCYLICDDDGDFYWAYKNCLYTIGIEIVQKRRLTQKKYCAKPKRRLETTLRGAQTEDDLTLASEYVRRIEHLHCVC